MKWYSFYFAMLISLLCFVQQNKAQEAQYNFVLKENYYTFTGEVYVQAPANCLLDYIYRFEYIPQYSAGAKSIDKVEQGKNWYDVTFVYQKLFFIVNESTWRRTLHKKQQKVVFTMLSNQSNLSLIPKVISSSGYYQIIPDTTGCHVVYFQECTIDSHFLQDLYIRETKKEAIAFLKEFEVFLKKNCEVKITNHSQVTDHKSSVNNH